MPVLSRSALESSPLADLHEIASEIGMDGYRRLRKADLVAAILEKQGGDDDAGAAEANGNGDGDGEEAKPARRSRRGGRGRSRTRDRDPEASDDGDDDDTADTDTDAVADSDDADEQEAPKPTRRSRGGRGGRGAAKDKDDDKKDQDNGDRRDKDSGDREDKIVTGTIELLANGSGFARVGGPDASDDDVYVSAAQIRRCELVDGDEVCGPIRAPRRSERHPSLARVDTINGRAADEVAEGTRFEDLPAAFPTERLVLDDDEPTLKAIAWLTPLGRGSRAAVTGAARSGKSDALRRIAGALHGQDDVEVAVVLAGVRPEELADWSADGLPEPTVAGPLGTAPDVLAQGVDRVAETSRRVAARGGNAILLVDGIDQLPPHQARRVLGSARDIVDGGSLTVIATAAEPLGGETTVIALDVSLTSTNRFPALDLSASGTLRPELLVGEKGAAAIAEARVSAL